MTSIYKTAFPHYSSKKKISEEILAVDYRLTRAELLAVRESSQNIDLQLTYAVLLMVFKNLGYFPKPISTIPPGIIDCIKEQLRALTAKFNIQASAISRCRQLVYDYFNIIRWKKIKPRYSRHFVNPAEEFAIQTALEAAENLDYPADIINVAIEQLKKSNYELPSFKQFDRLVKHAKSKVNQRIFDSVYQSLTNTQTDLLEKLLITTTDYMRSAYNDIKTLPKNPTINHFKELLQHHNWLISLGDMSGCLEDIAPVKLKQFAQQANSLDASDLKDFKKPKRYTLILCLVLCAQTRAKDALAISFCKTVIKMHKKAKEKLEVLKKSFSERTQELLGIFSEILLDIKEEPHTIKSLRKMGFDNHPYRKVL